MSNVFVTREAAPNIPSHAKKALGNMKRVGPEFDIIGKTLSSLRIKYKSPDVVGTTAVHFTIPKHKIAICFKTTNVSHSLRKQLVLKREGWYLSIIDPFTVLQMSPEAIKIQFVELIETIKLKNS